ncbi:MAG: HlyD family type I secretion periplasmic adaptor subunit [Desulfovibrio sp.]|nr:HlyD family type I secretion periplasmic adaptor subunit [Desulfovibrio sp.]
MKESLQRLWAALGRLFGRGDGGVKPGAVPRDILRFQPDSVLLERAAPPLGARVTLYALAASITFLILWSVFGRIDRIVTGEGRIVTMSQPVVLQSYSISIIKDIRVRMGQRVKKDDVLVVLDPTFAQADMSRLEERVTSLSTHLRRLQCELDEQPFPPPAAPGAPLPTSSEQREQRIQADIWRSRRDEYVARIRTYDEERKKLRTEIEATEADLERRLERLKIYREFESMREKLYKQGIEARAGWLEVKKDRLTVESDALRLKSSIQESRYELARVESDRNAYVTGWRSSAAQELVTVRRELDEAAEQYNKARKMGDLVNIRAPMDAVVLEIAKRNAGSVANEAEALVTLVPDDAPLEVEVEIQPQEIGYVRPGQTARVKLATLPFQKHGKIDAVLKAVSKDAFQKNTPAGEQNVYRARLELPSRPLESLRNLPEGFVLLPGMTVTAEINVGERRIIEYFLYPVLAGFDEGLREPR